MHTEKKSHRSRMDPIVALVLIFCCTKSNRIDFVVMAMGIQPNWDRPFVFRCYFFFHFGRWTNR